MTRKRSECEMLRKGFLYVPQWKTAKDAQKLGETEHKRKTRKTK